MVIKMKRIIKSFCIFYLAIQLTLLPINAFALITVNDWSVTNVTKQGQSAKISATRTKIINGSPVVQRSSALFSPSSAQLAKSLAKGIGAAALAMAVAQLIGQGVEWVLDPANNQIKYKEKTGPSYFRVFSGTWKDFTNYGEAYTFASSKCTKDFTMKSDFKLVASDASINVYDQSWSCVTPVDAGNTIRKVQAKTQTEERTLSLNEVATRIKSNAASGDATAQQAVADSAEDTITNDPSARQEVEDQLDQNSSNDTQEEPEPNDPDKPNQGVKLPKFCSWAPIVCEAAQVTINLPKTLTKWWDKATKEISETWVYVKSKFQEEPEFGDKDELEIELRKLHEPTQYDKDYVSFGGQCPTVDGLTVTIAGTTVHQAFDLSPLCTFATDWARPAILGLAYLTALGIISNAIRDT